MQEEREYQAMLRQKQQSTKRCSFYNGRPANSVVIIDQPAITHLGFPQTSAPEVEVEDDMPERYLGMNSPYMGGRHCLSFNVRYY